MQESHSSMRQNLSHMMGLLTFTQHLVCTIFDKQTRNLKILTKNVLANLQQDSPMQLPDIKSDTTACHQINHSTPWLG